MRHMLVRALAVTFASAGLAVSLAACATPAYPTSAGYVPPAPLQPEYSNHAAPLPAPEPARPISTPPTEVADQAQLPPPADEPAPAPEVRSQPLPDVDSGAAPSVAPGAAYPAQSEAAPAPPPDQEADAYRPPARRYRQEPGRVIAGGQVVPANHMFRDYEVQKGDHLDAIARDLETTRKVLIEANHLRSPSDLRPGQHLKVPVAKAYVADAGDTMITVARRFGVSPSELADLNNLPLRARLRTGDNLALPANFHDRGPTRLAPVTVVEETQPFPPVRREPARVYAPEPAPGPYVPSRAALAAASRNGAATATRGYNDYAPSSAPLRATPRIENLAASDDQVAAAGRGRFIWPVRGEILSPFGVKGVGRRNDGVDLSSPQGTTVRAAAAGEVVYAGDQVPGFGNLVLVKHADGWVTAYAHLDRTSVQMRQAVMQGQEIGEVGSSGGVSEPQLHFEVRYAPNPTDKARPVDPMLVLPR